MDKPETKLVMCWIAPQSSSPAIHLFLHCGLNQFSWVFKITDEIVNERAPEKLKEKKKKIAIFTQITLQSRSLMSSSPSSSSTSTLKIFRIQPNACKILRNKKSNRNREKTTDFQQVERNYWRLSHVQILSVSLCKKNTLSTISFSGHSHL